GHGVFGQKPLVEYHGFLAFELLFEKHQFVVENSLGFPVGYLIVNGQVVRRQKRFVRILGVLLQWAVQRYLPTVESLVHLDDLGLLHVEPVTEQLGGSLYTLGFKFFFFLAQVEKEFS